MEYFFYCPPDRTPPIEQRREFSTVLGAGAGGLEQGGWGLGRVSKGLGGWGLDWAEGLGLGLEGGGPSGDGTDGHLFIRSDVRSDGWTEIPPSVL